MTTVADDPQANLTTTADMLAFEKAHNPGLWNPDLVLTHGDGVKIYDSDGNEYYDCVAGIAVASVGHANPHLAQALAEQAKKLIICPLSYSNDVRVKFYQKLLTFLPQEVGLTRFFMANSGSEVNEAAMKWARAATGRHHFVAAKRGFSGRTMGVLGLTWEPKYREPFEPLAVPVTHVGYNNIAELDAAITSETAAVLIEPVQGEGGMNLIDGAFFQAARQLTRERGALLIVDEVQSGAGRTGKFLALEHYLKDYDVAPDMVTMAKGIGGGMPLSVLLLTEEVALKMPKGGHGTTFGGNALASAAGLAVLEELGSRDLLAHAAEVGAYFQEKLRALESPKIRSVRGLGLMIGVEFKTKVAPVISALKDAGVLCINAGPTVIRFVPPLIISKHDVDEIVSRLAAVLRKA